MRKFSDFGNKLHSEEISLPIVAKRNTWYVLAAIILMLLGLIAGIRGLNFGIEFTGGSEFQISNVANNDQSLAREVVREHVPNSEPRVALLGADSLRIQTQQLDSAMTAELASDLAEAYQVEQSQVSSSFIGPNWGSDVTGKSIQGVLVFIALVAIVMALYFKNITSSLAAMLALLHDLLFTVFAYGAIGFEITPASVIGFLTVLGYSLYDTVVIFDKVRENTKGFTHQLRRFDELVNLAANQTLVRSINTSVVALLPVGSILFIGAIVLGAGTLKDISLALFVGIIAGTYSSIVLAPNFLVDLRSRSAEIKAHNEALASGSLAAQMQAEKEVELILPTTSQFTFTPSYSSNTQNNSNSKGNSADA